MSDEEDESDPATLDYCPSGSGDSHMWDHQNVVDADVEMGRTGLEWHTIERCRMCGNLRKNRDVEMLGND